MSTPTFNARQGLNTICKGAMYKGVFEKHTEDEYNALEWLDIRDKPTWTDVEQAALTNLRENICDNINERTNLAILKEFRTSLSPDVTITASLEWQFDTLNIYLMRESDLITYPYNLHVGNDGLMNPSYITLNSVTDIQTLYIEMFMHINNWLISGRAEKQRLQTMTRTGLEEYRDVR